MNNSKKVGLVVSVAVIAVGAVIFTMKFAGISQYKKQIPALTDLNTFSLPLREQLSKAHDKALHNPSSNNLGMLGMAFHSGAFYENAVKCYKLAIKRDKSKWVWSYYLGYLNKEMGDAKAAIDNFTVVIQENHKVYLAWYYLGEAYKNTGSEEKAKDAFETIAFLPDNVAAVKTQRINYSSVQTLAKFELARVYLNSNKTDTAAELLEGIVRTNHSIGAVYRLLGNVYSAKGLQDMSKKYLTRAQDLAEVTSVADTLADRLSLISRSAQFLTRKIDDAVKSANPEWALQLLKHALRYMPEDKFIISKAVKFFLRMDIGREAFPYLDKHFGYFRDEANEMMELSDLLYKKGFYAQSMPYFARAVELKPSNIELQASYALSCWYDHRKDSARAIMKELFEKNRKDPRVLSNETAFMLITGDNNKAAEFIRIFKQLSPDDAKVPKLEAMIAESGGNQLEAISLYEASFKRDPHDIETARKLGALLLNQKMWDRSVKLFRNALDHHPNDPYLLERLGTLLVSCPDPKERNVDEGMELSERAFCHISSPSNTMISAARNLAQSYAIKGNFQQATYYITAAINIARGVNAPENFMKELNNLASKINYFSQKK
jgi:tetratricopeptide (TPR) repeat protein